MNIGQSIRHIRKTYAKQTQVEFCQSIGISQPYLSDIERCRSNATVGLLEIIADHVNIPIPILFWFGVEEGDVPNTESFSTLKPVIDSMMNELIKKT